EPLVVRFKSLVEENERLGRHWQATFDAANDAIWVLDPEHRILQSNQTAERFFGKPRQEMIGRHCWEIVHGNTEPMPEYPALRAKHSLRRESMELQVGDRWFEVTVDPILDGDGNYTGAVHIMSDITERKRAEDTLRESEERYRRISDLITDYAYAFRVEEGNKLAREWVTDSFTRITGYTPQEMDERGGWSSIIHPDDMPIALARARRLFGGENDVSEFRIIRKDGKICWLRDHGQPVWDETQGRVVRIYGAAKDITERKQAQDEIRRRASELEAVHKVSTALRAAQSAEEALPILLDETLAALQAESGVIWLYEPPRGELRAAATRGWFHDLGEPPIQPGEGIAGTVFSSGETHVSAEFAADPLTRASVRERVPSGWGGACVPIRSAAEVIGVLLVSIRAPRQITPKETKVLEALAEIAGAALHRLSLHDEALRRVRQLQALQTIDRAITAAPDSRVTLTVLLEQALAPLGADAAGVLLFDSHTLTLEYAAGCGFRGRRYERSRLRLGEGQAGLAALERRTICAADIAQLEPPFIRLPLLAGEELASYAVAPLIAKGQLLGVLEAFHRAPFEHSRDWLRFFETIANQAAIAIDNARLFEGLQRSNLELSLAYDATIEGWARALELRDQETEGHTRRVTDLTMRLARAAGISAEELTHVRRGALLHDIGKMGIPDTILLKPDKLTEEEWAVMRQHPTLAYDMLSPIAYLRPVLDIPYCHHEKWDGSGYPRGLKGEAIPLAARLFSVVDVWDALRSDRPYRKAWTEEETLAYIRAQSGKHFDPKAVELFFQVIGGNVREQ
ncbi:MAG: PAS domain S-box protein, partial [Anaerolineales bacterium]|nr:PAS domain S-box protein [Anaerolineales bacterium]